VTNDKVGRATVVYLLLKNCDEMMLGARLKCSLSHFKHTRI